MIKINDLQQKRTNVQTNNQINETGILNQQKNE
jgi:hypothetical protein